MKPFTEAEKTDSLDVLNYQIRACKRCRLALTRRHALTGEGNVDSRILFVALSPGAKEDVQNRMFVGPSGQVFNRLLNEVGIERKTVYMTNLVKCLLPKNRKPKEDEIAACGYFLDEEIAIIRPEVVVPLGYYATRSVLIKFKAEPLIRDAGFRKINGQILSLDEIKVLPLTHPSALLYNPAYEPETIEKYKKLKAFL